MQLGDMILSSNCNYIIYISSGYLQLSRLLSHQRPPWYNHTGWLGVKRQLTYLLTYLIREINMRKKSIWITISFEKICSIWIAISFKKELFAAFELPYHSRIVLSDASTLSPKPFSQWSIFGNRTIGLSTEVTNYAMQNLLSLLIRPS